jgi:hypothetical protein
MSRDPVEITELAIGYTNISGIHIPVDLPGNFTMRHLLTAQFICDHHQIGEWCFFKEAYAFFNAKKTKVEGFIIEIGYLHTAAKVQHPNINLCSMAGGCDMGIVF